MFVRSSKRISHHTPKEAPKGELKQVTTIRYSRLKQRNRRMIPTLRNVAFRIVEDLIGEDWENCKVLIHYPMLMKPVYRLVAGGWDRFEIIRRYRDILRTHHGLAVDNGYTKRSWSCSGIVADLNKLPLRDKHWEPA